MATAVIYSKQAAKALAKMPANVAATIRAKVDQLAADPAAQANNVKWIATLQSHRLRVGDYRVFFDDDGNVLAITAISHRKEAYR
jgi:mRNA interferase RelE/StbE